VPTPAFREISHERCRPSESVRQRSSSALDAEVDEAISLCGGDVRAALRATLLANAFLETEIGRLSEAVSAGFSRGKIAAGRSPGTARRKQADDGGSPMSVTYWPSFAPRMALPPARARNARTNSRQSGGLRPCRGMRRMPVHWRSNAPAIRTSAVMVMRLS
jgi:hypothetical protein